jgi:hypothetical protein
MDVCTEALSVSCWFSFPFLFTPPVYGFYTVDLEMQKLFSRPEFSQSAVGLHPAVPSGVKGVAIVNRL